nr:MAG TPA: hypothetical protein [Caudoviricetes sp.]
MGRAPLHAPKAACHRNIRRSLSSMRKAWSNQRRSRHTSQQRRRRQPRQPQTSSYIVQLRTRKHVDRAMALTIPDSSRASFAVAGLVSNLTEFF